MKIVLFDFIFEQSKPGITGLSDLVWNWAGHLVELGEDVHIVAPYVPDARPPRGVTVHRFPVPPIGYRNIMGHLLIVLRGWQEIRKVAGVDIIHAPEYVSTAVFGLAARDIPIVLTVPGNIYQRTEMGVGPDWSVTQVYKLAARLSARRCARIIVTSQEMAAWWSRTGAAASRLVFIPYGVDTKRFSRVPNARAVLGVAEDKRVVLYVGRLSHEKGLQSLLRAACGVAQSIEGLELHLVGDGPLKQPLEDLAKELGLQGRLVFHGWIDQHDLATYYSAADVTVLPSLAEGLPRVMMEAMACGSPFLGTRISGITDLVRHGETGFLVEPGDERGLLETLRLVLGDRSLAAAVAGRAAHYVQRELDWRVIVGRVREEVYRPAMRENRYAED